MIKILTGFFVETWQNNSKIDLEKQKAKENQNTPEEEYGGGRVAPPD